MLGATTVMDVIVSCLGGFIFMGQREGGWGTPKMHDGMHDKKMHDIH